MIKTLIFDLGGVVLNRGLWLFRKYLIKTYSVTDEQTINILIKKYYGNYFSGKMTEENYWNYSLKDLGITADWKKLKLQLLNYYKPNDGMFDLLDTIRIKGYKCILLSDQTKDWWFELNKKWHIESHFDECIISAIIGINKPDEQIYQIALEKSKTLAKDALFIDDLEDNLVPARKLGLKTILFRNTNQLYKDLASFGIFFMKILPLTQDRFVEAVNVVFDAKLDTRDEIEHHLKELHAHYIALDQDRVIGVIGWYQDNVNYATEAMGDKFPGDKAYWVGFFAVDEKYRGQGIGFSLIQKLEQVLLEKGANEVWVSSVPETTAYYKRQGFKTFIEGKINGNRKVFMVKRWAK